MNGRLERSHSFIEVELWFGRDKDQDDVKHMRAQVKAMLEREFPDVVRVVATAGEKLRWAA